MFIKKRGETVYVDELIENNWKAKTNCVFPAYNDMNASIVRIGVGEAVKVDFLKRDEKEYNIIMCKVNRVSIRFIITLEQLKNNFIAC